MTDLPQPLTPADCDLRGLPYMPLDVIRLLDSDMFAEATGDEFKAAVSLWCKSWTQVPAASLPNKDKVLSALAGKPERWSKIKAMAMHGWILCSDDRWYHPVVAEKALAALPGREEFNDKKSADAERKAREREDRKALFELLKSHGIVPEWNVSTKTLRAMSVQYQQQESHIENCDESRDMSQRVTVSKGEGEEREREGIVKQGSAEPGIPRPVEINTLLRKAGITGCTAMNPHIAVTWAQNPAVTDAILLAAVDLAKERKTDGPVPVGYLPGIINSLLNPVLNSNRAPGAPAGPMKKDWL